MSDEPSKIELPLVRENGTPLSLKDYDWKEWEKTGQSPVMMEESWPTGSLVGVEAKVKEDSQGATVEFKKLEDQTMPTSGARCYPKVIPVPPPEPGASTPKMAQFPIVTMLIVRMDEVPPESPPGVIDPV